MAAAFTTSGERRGAAIQPLEPKRICEVRDVAVLATEMPFDEVVPLATSCTEPSAAGRKANAVNDCAGQYVASSRAPLAPGCKT